jgi:hypothetical protein
MNYECNQWNHQLPWQEKYNLKTNILNIVNQFLSEFFCFKYVTIVGQVFSLTYWGGGGVLMIQPLYVYMAPNMNHQWFVAG